MAVVTAAVISQRFEVRFASRGYLAPVCSMASDIGFLWVNWE